MISKINSLLKKAYSVYRLSKYNSYTIAEHFRSQGAQVGNDCFFSVRSLGNEPYLVKIGNHVGIASGVRFLTHSLGWNYRDRIPDLQIFGKIEIKDNCNIGVDVIILPDVTIGENCIVAAGSVVTKDIPPNSIAAGVPAKVIGNSEDYFKIAQAKWMVQKPEGYMLELKKGVQYSPQYMAQVRNKKHYKILLRKHLTKLYWGKEY